MKISLKHAGGFIPNRIMRITENWDRADPKWSWIEKYHLESSGGRYRFMNKIPGNGQWAPGPDEMRLWFRKLHVERVDVRYGHSVQDALKDRTGSTFPDGLAPVESWLKWCEAMDDEREKACRKIVMDVIRRRRLHG